MHSVLFLCQCCCWILHRPTSRIHSLSSANAKSSSSPPYIPLCWDQSLKWVENKWKRIGKCCVYFQFLGVGIRNHVSVIFSLNELSLTVNFLSWYGDGNGIMARDGRYKNGLVMVISVFSVLWTHVQLNAFVDVIEIMAELIQQFYF